ASTSALHRSSARPYRHPGRKAYAGDPRAAGGVAAAGPARGRRADGEGRGRERPQQRRYPGQAKEGRGRGEEARKCAMSKFVSYLALAMVAIQCTLSAAPASAQTAQIIEPGQTVV